jgi:hypothetical protein
MMHVEDGQVYSWGKSDNFLTGLGTEKDVILPLRMECFDSPVLHVSIHYHIALLYSSIVFIFPPIAHYLYRSLMFNIYLSLRSTV